MNENRPSLISLAILVSLATLLADQPTLACSVCYGDASSELVKGAQAGMLVLVGVIGTVLLGFISVLVFWARRAARLENPGEGV